MKLDGYVRVSRVNGRTGDSFLSPKLQRDAIAAWAARERHEIAAWHEDLDASGGSLDRPGFNEALDRIESGATGGMVVARLDRFARSVVKQDEAITRIRKAGGKLLSTSESIDPDSPDGRLVLNLLASIAQSQRERASEQWKAADRELVERGGYHIPPFGYAKPTPGQPLVPDPETAAAVREGFRLAATGASCGVVARMLNDRGHKTTRGNTWTPSAARKMLTNRAYLGEARRGEALNAEAHPPLVTLSEFERANRARPTRRVRRGRDPEPLLLQGLVRCTCLYSMVREATGHPRYRCKNPRCDDHAAALVEDLDHHAFGYMMLWAADAARDEGAPRGPQEEAEEALRDAQAKLDRYLDSPDLRDGLSDASLARIIASQEAAVRKAQEALDGASREARDARDRAERARTLADAWDDGGQEEKRALVAEMIGAIYVRGNRGPVEGRTLTFWRGEEPTLVPRPGAKSFDALPFPWPEGVERFVNIPAWAWGQALDDEWGQKVMEARTAMGARGTPVSWGEGRSGDPVPRPE